MRDPDRIPVLLDLIKEIWKQSPELRFNQLLYNLQHDYSQTNAGVGQVIDIDTEGITRVGYDLFYLEDSTFIEFLRSAASRERAGQDTPRESPCELSK